MRKLCVILAAMSVSSYGASVDHIMNYTAEYNANPALQGAVSEESSINYNPAGIMKLENGIYINGGLQLAIGEQGMSYNNEDYNANYVSAIPNLSVYRKTDDKAFFWTIGPLGGGAEVGYKDGIAVYDILGNTYPYSALGTAADGSYAKGSSQYIQSTLGTAFNITDKISMAVAARGVIAERNFEGDLIIEGAGYGSGQTATIDAERDAVGYGAQIGFNFEVNSKLNIGLRYDTKIALEFKTDSKEEKITTPVTGFETYGFSNIYSEYADGAKYSRDLPAILALGMQYKVVDDVWTLYTGGNYYFNKSADFDTTEYENGWELALGSEYWVKGNIAWLIGMNYADTGAASENYRDSEFVLDSFMIGTGVKYKFDEKLEILASVSHYFYESAKGTTKGSTVEYEKSISLVGFGFSKRI